MKNFIPSFLAYLWNRAYLLYYCQKNPLKLLNFIKKNNSLYRINSLEKVIYQINLESNKKKTSFCRTIINKYKQSLIEQKTISYRHWITHIELKPTSNIQLINDSTTLLVFIIEQEISPRLLSISIDSLQKQTCNAWKLIIITSDKKKYSNNMKIKNNKLAIYETINTQKVNETINQIIMQQNSNCYINIIPQGCQLNYQAVQDILKSNHKADIIYTDEDQLDINNIRTNPHFKPDWNLDYFCSYNYLSHTTTLKGEFFSTLISPTMLSNDHLYTLYQLLNYNQSKLTEAKVKHIPSILFHIPNNTPLPKPQRKIPCDPKQQPKVSIIIPTKDELNILKKCINSIIKNTSYNNIEIIIINNRSEKKETFDYLKYLKRNPFITVLSYDKTFNYSAINNYAVKHTKGSLLAFINNDIESINAGWLTEMVAHACRPDIGCVGAKLYYPDGTIQHGGVILGLHGTASHAHKGFAGDSTGYFGRLSVAHNVSAVTAACMVMRKDLFIEAGGFDAVNLTVAYNDVDLCLKVLELGYRNLWTPFAELIHYESKSRGKKHTKETRARLDKEEAFMRNKWMKYLENDPAYNINLTLIREDFSLGNNRKVKPPLD